jgi:predicted ArsR family transcriptional regulator
MTTNAPGLGESQRSILGTIKRLGTGTIRHLADELDLNVETVRDHLKSLTALGLVQRAGTVKDRPGRPEIVYTLTAAAESAFPRREGEVLRSLALFLKETGNESLLREFYERFIESRREEALARVEGLTGRARSEEVARILTEFGFMAEITGQGDSPTLRLCHCPLRDLVHATNIPCRAEVGFIHELLGERTARVSHIGSGDSSCSYLIGPEAA